MRDTTTNSAQEAHREAAEAIGLGRGLLQNLGRSFCIDIRHRAGEPTDWPLPPPARGSSALAAEADQFAALVYEGGRTAAGCSRRLGSHFPHPPFLSIS